MQTYIVKPGDTLYGISGQFGVTIEQIKAANNLKNNQIVVGQALKIPTSSTTFSYIVKKGDTLYAIAKRYDVSVNQLIQINNLNGTSLAIGQQLQIPIGDSTTTDNYALYTVKVGDSLYAIAKRYGTTVDTIMKLNNLNSTLLSIGQQLKIPIMNGDVSQDEMYIDYVVKSGDSLYKIANAYNMTVDELIELNNLKSTLLTVGQILKVKKDSDSGYSIPLGSTCYGTGYKEPTYVLYTVKRGDNLYNIARKYDVSVDEIVALNNLSSTNLSIGQVLKIKEVQ